MERECQALASGVKWLGADNLFGARFRERRFGHGTRPVIDRYLHAFKDGRFPFHEKRDEGRVRGIKNGSRRRD